MPAAAVATVARYLAAQPPAARSILKRVRAAIRKALPKAEETLSYKIPTYRVSGKAVIYFAAWKNHYSIYPATATLVAEFGDKLAPYEISKGTIRFSYADPVPTSLITKLAAFRAKETAGPRKAR